jgi:DNA-binding response OmpR family regulator
MKVLVVEDDARTAQMIRANLSSDNHVVELAEDGNDASFLARSFNYDAIILDNSLPKKDGLTICKEIRAIGKSTPILFLTIDNSLETKINAFKYGADDFMSKPFSLQELNMRLKVILKRNQTNEKTTIKVGDLEMDTDKRIVSRAGKKIRMTKKEFILLEYFMKNVGVILSRSLLMEHVWTADSNVFSNTLEAHIRNLRKKLCAGRKPNLILNVPGRGYVIDTPENLKNI